MFLSYIYVSLPLFLPPSPLTLKYVDKESLGYYSKARTLSDTSLRPLKTPLNLSPSPVETVHQLAYSIE